MMSTGAFYAAAGDRRNSVPNSNSAASDGQAYDMHPTAGGQHSTAAYAPSTASLEGNMAELLEAAAKATTESQRHAAAQQQQQQQQQAAGVGGLRKVARVTDLRGTAMHEEALGAAGQKRKRTATPPNGGGGEDMHHLEGGEVQEGGRAGSQSPRKRARQTPTTGLAELQHHAPSADIHHYHHQQHSPTLIHQQHQQQAGFGLTDVRAVGVHSAAALFRQPSGGSATKKHTRPPMSKLFASLQLTPENFLRLQAAAKTYMLDEAHPERQSCVGSRGKGDTDMVKLRLFNCCRDFLNDGIGERFFGPDVPAPTENEVLEGETMPGRKWVWPRDGNKIVSLVTPLLRRMVTNERQRQYAQEARKGTGKRKSDVASGTPSAASHGTSSQDAAAAAAAAAATGATGAASTPPPSTVPFDASHSPPNPAIDPSLSTPQPPPPPAIPAAPPHVQPHYPAHAPTQTLPHGPPPTQYPRFLQTQPPQSIYSTAISPPAHPAATATGTAANSNQHQQHFHHHHPQPAPDQNVIQVLITKNNTKLLPRIDMPSWPSTPHHTLPLVDLRQAVEEEIRGLLKRGLDLGIRRRATTTKRPMTPAVPTVDRAGESVAAPANASTTTTTTSAVTSTATAESQQPADVDMAEAGNEQDQQQQQTGPNEKNSAHEDGDGEDFAATTAQQRQQQQPQPQPPPQPQPQSADTVNEQQQEAVVEEAEEEEEAAEAGEEEQLSLEDITLEIRALTGRGLVLIADDKDWRAVLAEVGQAVWMEGVLRVVVEVI
ncbi:uncharacterized protein BKCO1_1700013 [Diplodia corticola]|uniref:Uncharacterized protein n=1 Tax=Diplodia corticola TaxID=236234 RepID=A0A1J9R217_9PEZI|nr:uncharacterized protein BKCO1_1700013 [Diplodia corticola]OJD35438.1 hypothetical protein BKCO1_1700013 [Diplodia corticola]